MKRLLVDLNVVLDVILDRRPGADVAAALWTAVERGHARGLIHAHGLTTIFYLLERARGGAFARQGVERLIGVFAVAPVDESVVRRALSLAWPDFEDAVCAAAAEASGCDALVTRDPDGYPDASLPIIEPAAALSWIAQDGIQSRSTRRARRAALSAVRIGAWIGGRPPCERKSPMKTDAATLKRVYAMSLAGVYPHYLAKAEKKGRTKAEVDEIIRWLTGYSQKQLDSILEKRTNIETFISRAKMNPSRTLVTGAICGVRVEEIEDPVMQGIRYLDKLIDELAKGRPMEKILRKA